MRRPGCSRNRVGRVDTLPEVARYVAPGRVRRVAVVGSDQGLSLAQLSASGATLVILVAGALFLVLAVLARFDALPWDRPVTQRFVGWSST